MTTPSLSLSLSRDQRRERREEEEDKRLAVSVGWESGKLSCDRPDAELES